MASKRKEQGESVEVPGIVTGYFSWFAPEKVEIYTNRSSGKPDGQFIRPPKIKASIVVQTGDQYFTINCNKLDEPIDQKELDKVPKAIWKTVDKEIRKAFPVHTEVVVKLVRRVCDGRTITRAYLKDE